MEETPEIRGCGCGDFFRRQVSHTSERTRYFRDVGRLVTFATIGLWGQKWRIGFDEDTVQGNITRDITDILCFGIGGVTRKRNHKPSIKSPPGFLKRAGKTMEDAAQPSGAPDFLDKLEAIGPRVAAMDDDGKFGFMSEGHLPAKNGVLRFAWRVIVKIIESNLAPGDDLGMFC